MNKSKVAAVALAGLITFSSLGSASAALTSADVNRVKQYVVNLKKSINKLEADSRFFSGKRKQTQKGSPLFRKYTRYLATLDASLLDLRKNLAADQELLVNDLEEYHAQGSNQ